MVLRLYRRALVFAWSLLIGLAAYAQAQTPDSVDQDFGAELPRIPALSLEDARKSFEIAAGFELSLVAAEPLVTDPVAFAFDARYRLFVVEMRDYSEQETEHLGSIALLEDTDGDGKMDRRSVYVDGLSWPTAVWPWKDGVLVAEPPRITWYRDTDDDGRSDQSQDWFVGFGRSNVQGLVNSLRWGVDGFLHGATSSSGAEIESDNVDGEHKLLLGRRDFFVDTLQHSIMPEAGGGQHGLSFNRWGDKFVTSNSDHLQQIVDLDWWLAGRDSRIAFPSSRRSIAVDGPQAEVFRISPVEPWRIVRTRLRVSGVAPGIVEGGGRAAGYFTGATGTWIMDRDAGFGDPNADTAIICDVGSNLVHRKLLRDEHLFWSGSRLDNTSELLRSRDIWFRPVQLGDGPDGSLIVADMAREVIEHPKSLPAMIKKHLDLTSGRNRGRIWRLAPQGQQSSLAPPPGGLSSRDLVSNLSHPIAWQRRMASQLLLEREAKDLEPQLRQATVDSPNPEGQILALHVLNRLGLFSSAVAQPLLASEHERVLQHVVRLIHLNNLPLDLSRLTTDQRPRLQLEVALASTAGTVSTEQRTEWLAKLLVQAETPLVQAVIATAAGDASWQLVAQAESKLSSLQREAWFKLLMPVWTKQMAGDQALRTWMLDKLTSDGQDSAEWRAAISRFTDRADVDRLHTAMTAEQRRELNQAVELELEAALQSRLEGARNFDLMRIASPRVRQGFAEQLLRPSSTNTAQRAVLSLLAWSGDGQLANLVVERFLSLTPSLQSEALRALAARTTTAAQLAAAIEKQDVPVGLVPIDIREQLRNTRDKELAAKFAQLLGTVTSDRQSVLEIYIRAAPAASSNVDSTAGREVFRSICAQCHKLGEIGNDVGPPLKQLREKSAEQLLENILDPNREIDPKFISTTILTNDDEVLTGIIQEESAGQIILRSAGGSSHAIPRAEIAQMKSSGNSLMPVGLEASITPVQMFQLIAFLKSTE